MKAGAALLSLVSLASMPALASERIPQFNVQATCNASAAADKAMALAEPQSVADCMRDEMDARQQLTTLWQSNPGPVRESCEGEAVAGGNESYVDLLTCLQMADLASSSSSAAPLKGASKKRSAR